MQNQPANGKNHDIVVGLLPWFVQGRLSVAESASVEQHLPHCADCRSQVRQLQAISETTNRQVSAWKPSPAHFAGIMANIDNLQTSQPSAQLEPIRAGLFVKLTEYFAQTPVVIRWAIGVETAVFAILAWVLILPAGLLPETSTIPEYETLSNVEQGQGMSSTAVVKLILSPDMNLQELTALLKQTAAQMRDGPSPTGAFTIEIPKSQIDTVMTVFRNHPKIRFSEPVVVP